MKSSAVTLLVCTLCLVGASAQGFLDCSFAGCFGEPQCEVGSLLTPNATLFGCCPGCVAYLDLNATCDPAQGPKCQPGLVCTNKKCKVPVEGKCFSYPFRNLKWEPKCEPDGTFSAVQCKGERLTGRCFCTSKEGKRIFGQQWWGKAENMTCGCSRKVEDLKAKGRIDVTLHCTEEGNFDILQCDSGVCWCADEYTGLALGEVVPQPMMEMLPCYNETVVGDSYLRLCDSAEYALNAIQDEMVTHGTLGDAFVSNNCGLDGSYGEYQFEIGRRFCSWKDRSAIGSFATEEIPAGGLTCNCARDTKYFAASGFGFTLICGGNGNYNTLQRFDDGNVCVDKDGFAYAPAVYIEAEKRYDCPSGVLPEPA